MSYDRFRDYQDVEHYKEILCGKTVKDVRMFPDVDEGIILTFSDGSTLGISFSSCYGGIEYNGEDLANNPYPMALTDLNSMPLHLISNLEIIIQNLLSRHIS